MFRPPSVCTWIILVAITLVSLPLSADDLELGAITTLPAQSNVRIPVYLSADDDVNAVNVAFTYNDTRATLAGYTLEGSVLEDEAVDSVEIIEDVPGEAVLSIVVDGASPYTREIDAGTDVVIATLLFDVSDFQFAGTEIPLEFADGLSYDEIDNEIFVNGSGSSPDSTTDGMITITSDDHLVVGSATARPGALGLEIPIRAFNIEAMGGYSVAMQFDPDVVSASEFSIVDTITESVGAEFTATVIDNDEGTAIYGVLLDYLPPFEAQDIPPSGIVLEIARIIIDIKEDVTDVSETELELVDGLGDPPIDNVFVVGDDEALSPEFVDGVINILTPLEFVRGEVNGDGFLNVADPIVLITHMFLNGPAPKCEKTMDINDNGVLDLADPILLLEFLFQNGPEPAAPYPDPGFDPTPDDLPCEE